ncbi:MAG TPA: TMEM175 family protein [Chloroflexota bacterium]|nr:TMEM175 family protein [Chloroflexota bacterium]
MTEGPPERPRQVGLGTSRLETLTDGIFAIAMTLLVLNLQVPQIPAALVTGRLPHALLDLWPKLLSYALSFVVVGVYWVGHHNQFHYIRRADRPFIWMNILFLMCIAFIPFSAALLGAYVHARIAVGIYGLNLVVVGAALYLIWWYATADHRLVDPDLAPTVVQAGGRRVLVGVVVYLLAVLLSLLSTVLSVALYIAVPILYILPGRIDRHVMGRLTPGAPDGERIPPGTASSQE